MTKSLEHTITARYIATGTPMQPPKIPAGLLAVHEMIEAMAASLVTISEDAETVDVDPSDPTTSKKSLAIMIAGALNRIADNSNPVNTNFLVAALALVQLSDGNDQLMTVARRLAVKGMTPTKKKIKEETLVLAELSKNTLNKYVDDNHTNRRKNLGKLIRTKTDKAQYQKRLAGASTALKKLWLKKNRPNHSEIHESVNYKHKAIDDAHEIWKSQIDYANKIADEMGHRKTPEHVKGSKEQIAKVKEFVDKHPPNRVPNAMKMADHAGISDGLAAHFHKALKAVTESGKAKEKPFTQADRVGRYLKDQRASRRLR